MCPISYYLIMRNCKDKKHHRLQMVNYALSNGVKATARTFKTSPNVVRKWIKRLKTQGFDGLADLSRKPHNSPNKTSDSLRQFAIYLKHKYKRLGAEQIKIIEYIPLSAKTMRKIWKEEGISTGRRRKKYITKRNLRAIKRDFDLFQQSCEDTKDLTDIPEYFIQMKLLKLPSVQYTFREVSCGIKFLGFADKCSLIKATLFAKYINFYLTIFKVLNPNNKYIRQTDHGSEYIGSWNAKYSSSYTKAIESLPGQFHSTIFPGAHRMQADVETVHNLIEKEFYELETFKDRQDFLNKAYTYQLFFNLERPNTYKENKTPWQLAKEKVPTLDKRLLMIPPVDLDALFRANIPFLRQGGKYLLTVP